MFGSKTTIYLSCDLHKGRHKEVTKKAVISHHPAIQNMKFLNFFLILWVIFALMDPDPDSEYGSGSSDLTEFGSGSETLLASWFTCRCAVGGGGTDHRGGGDLRDRDGPSHQISFRTWGQNCRLHIPRLHRSGRKRYQTHL